MITTNLQENGAEIQPVRPFNIKSLDQTPDFDFVKWKEKHTQPLALEIGAGAGWHSINWAKKHPKDAIITIERTKNKFLHFQSRLNNHQLPNIFPKNIDAHYWLPNNLAPNSIHSLFLLYPNPYPKEKQANKRWHRNSLFEFILKTLIPGGKIHLATNELFYAQEAHLYMTEFWKLAVFKKQVIHKDKDFTPRTHFEKKYWLNGETLYDFIFEKK